MKETDELLGVLGVGGVLPVDVETVETQVLDERHGRGDERVDLGLRVRAGREAGAVRPPADGEEGLEITVLLLQEEELFHTAVDIWAAGVVPGVGGIVLLEVGVRIGEVTAEGVSCVGGTTRYTCFVSKGGKMLLCCATPRALPVRGNGSCHTAGKAQRNIQTYTSPLSGFTFANAYNTCVSVFAGSCWG